MGKRLERFDEVGKNRRGKIDSSCNHNDIKSKHVIMVIRYRAITATLSRGSGHHFLKKRENISEPANSSRKLGRRAGAKFYFFICYQ